MFTDREETMAILIGKLTGGHKDFKCKMIKERKHGGGNKEISKDVVKEGIHFLEFRARICVSLSRVLLLHMHAMLYESRQERSRQEICTWFLTGRMTAGHAQVRTLLLRGKRRHLLDGRHTAF